MNKKGLFFTAPFFAWLLYTSLYNLKLNQMIKQLFFAISLSVGVCYSQDYRSGDTDLDASLKIVNTNGKENLSNFKLDLSKRFSVSLPKVEACFSVGMNPGDALMAFQIASIQRIPIDNVITVYKTNKSKGWGVMAKELGIKPGSSEFHALKGKVKEHSKGNAKKSTSKTSTASKGSSNGKSKGNSGKGKK